MTKNNLEFSWTSGPGLGMQEITRTVRPYGSSLYGLMMDWIGWHCRALYAFGVF